MSLSTIRFHSSMDKDAMIAALNENFALLENLNRVYTVKDLSGNQRVLLGQGTNGFNGLKVSKVGIDVTKATNDQLVFNSDNNIFKIVKSSTSTVVTPNPMVGGTFYTNTVAHGLGYTPAFLAFVTTPVSLSGIVAGAGNQIYNTPYSFPFSVGTRDEPVTAQARADSVNIYFDVINYHTSNLPGADGNWVFKYYLLQETAV